MVINPHRRTLAGWLSAAQIGTIMLLVWAGLRLFPLTRVLRWCGNGAGETLSPKDPGRVDSAYADRMAWAAQAVGRRLFGSGPCLVQALALNWFYSRHGIPGQLYIGVDKEGHGRLAAHAWLESEGRVMVGGPEEMLAGFARLPALTQEGQ